MLILTGQIDQTVHIGDDITVTVPDVKDHQTVRRAVRIGVEAPKVVEVDCGEIRRRKDAERKVRT